MTRPHVIVIPYLKFIFIQIKYSLYYSWTMYLPISEIIIKEYLKSEL